MASKNPSFSVFLDFLSKSGTTKTTVVRSWKKSKYSPATDYYKRLRDGLAEFQDEGHSPSALLSLADLAPADKRSNFLAVLAGLQPLLNEYGCDYIKVSAKKWKPEPIPLSVNVAPEVALRTPDGPVFIKLHYRKEKLKKATARLAGQVVVEALRGKHVDRTRVIILDAQHGVQHISTGFIPDLHALLVGEAACWSALWDAL